MYQILLIQDYDSENCKIKDYLVLSGFDVKECMMEEIGKNTDQLRNKSRIENINAIILNCAHPKLYFELCRTIRRMTLIPIIVLSNENDEWSKIKMFQAGVDDYLVDSLLQGELIARLQGHIERYNQLTRPLGFIEVGTLQINVSTRQISVEGKEIFLRAKEFDILLYLAQRINQVVSKEEIYEKIWKDDLGGGYYNSVAVHIKRIREKIELHPDSPKIIETVWGIGYRLRS